MTPKELRYLEEIASLRDTKARLERWLALIRVRRVNVKVYELPLWLIMHAPKDGTLLECDIVKCRLGGTLLAARCLDRQAKKYPSGKRKGAPRFPECQGCSLGEGYRARLPGYLPPKDSDAAQVLSPEQRKAREKHMRSLPDAGPLP